MTTPRILIIAGSDSGGGAGIQADVKTVTMLGGHAMTAITAITAQNTLGVQAVMPVPAEMVVAQIDSVASDIGIDAVKIGMLGSPATAQAVAERLERLAVPLVFDPVMVAKSGDRLLAEVAAGGNVTTLIGQTARCCTRGRTRREIARERAARRIDASIVLVLSNRDGAPRDDAQTNPSDLALSAAARRVGTLLFPTLNV